eukprot:58005_1
MAVVNIDELESDPNSYWGMRLRKFLEYNPESGYENFQTALKDDAAAWSVFAALLMTVGFAALAISPGDFYEDNPSGWNEFFSYIYVSANSLSGMLSFLAVVQGTQKYSFYNNLPAEMMDTAISRARQINIAPLVYVAIIFQGIGVVAGVYLLFGTNCFWVVLIIATGSITTLFVFWYLQIQSYHAINMSAGVFVEALTSGNKQRISNE